MRHPDRLPVLGMVLLLGMSSCAPKRSEVLLDTKVIDAPTLIALVKKGQSRLQSIVGGGSVTFESPEIAGTAAFDIAMKKPDSLLVRFEGPFGIDVGMFFLSREKYVVYNRMENRVITGVPRAKALRTLIPFDLTYEQILNAFSGIFSFPADSAEVASYRVDDDRFFLSFKCGEAVCNYWVDPEYRLVTKYQVRDAQDRIVMEADASGLTEQDDVSAAKRIKVTFPEDDRQISIHYSTLTLNASEPSFVFAIPTDAKTTVR
jgi:hypothetical protein